MRINYYREEILKFCKKPRTVTEIKNKFNVSFGTISYHLKILKEQGKLISKKNKHSRGQETKYKKNE